MNRLLFISYYFPPSGGPGVQRTLKFVKYLEEFGWRPTVVTVRPDCASYPDLDPDLADEIPLSVDVERTYAWDPYALYARMVGRAKDDVVSVGFLGEAETNVRQRLARWVRANVFLPDARVGWTPFAAARAHALIEEGGFDAILTTGPPHSTHLAGLLVRLIHQIPWIVDLRDPWSGIDYAGELPTTAAARGIDRWLERTVLHNASACVVVSESMGRQVLETTRTPVDVIENGFDPADFESKVPPASSNLFVIRHVGNLNQARNPWSLWKALKALRPHETMPDLRLSFVGNVEPAVLTTAADFGLADLIETEPYVPHADAVDLMRESAVLLLSVNRVEGAEGIVTGKVYEYVAAGRPVLGIGPPHGDAARVIGSTGAGRLFDFEDVDGLKASISAYYDAWRDGRRLEGAAWDRALWYSRKRQAGRLVQLLESIRRGAGASGAPNSQER